MTDPRPLARTEVTFEVTIEPEDLDHREQFTTDSGDVDRELVDEISRRLERGQQEAWCTLVVKVSWTCPPTGKTYTASASLGAVSLDAGRNPSGVRRYAERHAKAHDLYAEALDRLNAQLRARIAEARTLESYLADKGARRKTRAAKKKGARS